MTDTVIQSQEEAVLAGYLLFENSMLTIPTIRNTEYDVLIMIASGSIISLFESIFCLDIKFEYTGT